MGMVLRNWRQCRKTASLLLLLGEEKRQVGEVGDWVCEGVMRRTAQGAAPLYNGDDNDGNKNKGSEGEGRGCLLQVQPDCLGFGTRDYWGYDWHVGFGSDRPRP